MIVGVEVGRIVREGAVVGVAVRRRMRRGLVLELEENQDLIVVHRLADVARTAKTCSTRPKVRAPSPRTKTENQL